MLIARLPIFNSDSKVLGYEFRIDWAHDLRGTQGDELTTIAENIDDLAGDGWALIPLPAEVVATGGHEVLARDRVIVQPLGKAESTVFKTAVSRLRDTDYKSALPRAEGQPAGTPGSIVTMPSGSGTAHAVTTTIDTAHAAKCLSLVTGVDTHDTLAECRELGFDLFQGRFFCQRLPDAPSNTLTVDQRAAINLASALQRPDVLLRDIERLDHFPGNLSDRLLEMANRAGGRRVESLRHAVGTVGLERIRRWASMILLSTVTNKPRELFITAAIRARMCELLADSDREDRQATFFSAGLLSVFDALLDKPMRLIAEDLPVAFDVREALVDGEGVLGATLDAILSYETADWKSYSLRPFHPPMIRSAYFDALQRTRALCLGLGI